VSCGQVNENITCYLKATRYVLVADNAARHVEFYQPAQAAAVVWAADLAPGALLAA
jgi:hypothetical protein